MRPVERGLCPQDADGVTVVFKEYGHAKPYLILRLGDYCSFCEVPLPTPAVEHIRHKDGNPDLECTWTNFLLACTSCNSTKGTTIDTEKDVQNHLWPDQDRSFEAFVYDRDGVVRLAGLDDAALMKRAAATADLVGLLKRPGTGLTTDQLLRASDRRWEKRREVWLEATDAQKDLAEEDTPKLRKYVLRTAKARGFWSVWLTVFRNDPEMVAELCSAAQFPGTAFRRVMPLSAIK